MEKGDPYGLDLKPLAELIYRICRHFGREADYSFTWTESVDRESLRQRVQAFARDNGLSDVHGLDKREVFTKEDYHFPQYLIYRWFQLHAPGLLEAHTPRLRACQIYHGSATGAICLTGGSAEVMATIAHHLLLVHQQPVYVQGPIDLWYKSEHR